MSASPSRSAGAVLLRPSSWRRVLRFAGLAIAAGVSPSTYTPAAREVAVRQIYLTAWRILAGYTLASAFASWILIELVAVAARRYGVERYSLELVLSVLVLEVVPLVTAFFVALRSGAAIGAEIALACVRGELDDRAEAEASPLHVELVPRIAGAALSVAALTTIGCLVTVWLAYTMYYGFTSAGADEFAHIVARVFDGAELAAFLVKCLLFGFAVAVIPAAAALEAERGVLKSLPAVVLAGLVKLFLVIALVQVGALVVKYA